VNIPPLIEGPVHVTKCKPGEVIQQGRLLMVVLDRVPDGATPIPNDGPVELHTPTATFTRLFRRNHNVGAMDDVSTSPGFLGLGRAINVEADALLKAV